MKKNELLINICLGCSLIYWGIAGFYTSNDTYESIPIIRIFITALNVLVGILILFRKPVLLNASLQANLISLPSFLCGGLLFKFAKPLFLWEAYIEILFIFGGSLTFISFLCLGRNFSILPKMRKIVSKGTFRWVRHPAYLGEMLMLLACLLSSDKWFSWVIFLLFIPSLVFRIQAEEKLLSKNEVYLNYKKEVKWRLIPFIW